MKIKKFAIHVITSLVLLFSYSFSSAALPPTIDYQGHLTNDSGVPVDGSVNMTFRLYNVSAGGSPEWSETLAVTVNQGVFSVELGSPTPFPVGIFEFPLWVGVTVGADTEMIPRRPVTSTGYAFKAGDANTLEGISASTLDQSAHVGDTSNPHSVTAAQTGALAAGDLTSHTGDASAHHTKTSSFGELSGQAADLQIPALIARDSEIAWNNLGGIPAGFADNIDDDSGGDITGVAAGSGLSGGGASGSVILNHADTSSQASVNNSSGVVIQDIILDSLGHLTGITSANLDSRYFTESESDARFVNATGDVMTGFLTVGGEFNVDSAFDIHIYDDYNGFRWYSTDKTTQFGSIEINSSKNEFHDYNQGRSVFYSSANGIGIGTSIPVAGHAVTMPSLNVTGGLVVGSMSSLNITGSLDVGTVLNFTGTGSTNGIKLGSDQTDPVYLYHTSAALRMNAAHGRFQFGSLEYIEDCGGNCIAFPAADVGFGTATPAVRVHINDPTDASFVNGSGALLIGSETSTNLIFDNNEIIARTNGVASKLYLNQGGTHVVVPGLQITGGADLVEPFDVDSLEDIKAGMVMAIDADNPGQLRIADKAYDRTVAGVVSGANGINPGLSMAQQGSIADGSQPIALTGRLYALADAGYGDIRPGDMLTTSNTPGHVMKVTDHNKAQGSIIGKAMTPLDDGKGYVLILVSLQ